MRGPLAGPKRCSARCLGRLFPLPFASAVFGSRRGAAGIIRSNRRSASHAPNCGCSVVRAASSRRCKRARRARLPASDPPTTVTGRPIARRISLIRHSPGYASSYSIGCTFASQTQQKPGCPDTDGGCSQLPPNVCQVMLPAHPHRPNTCHPLMAVRGLRGSGCKDTPDYVRQPRAAHSRPSVWRIRTCDGQDHRATPAIVRLGLWV